MEPPPYIVSAPGKDSRKATPGVKVITLLTDFGLKDPYVGIMKGVIHTIAGAHVAPSTVKPSESPPLAHFVSYGLLLV